MLAAPELTPDAVSYHAAVSACEKGKQWEGGLALLQWTVRKELMPDVVSYSAAITACGEAWNQALRVLKRMLKLDLEFECICKIMW